MKKNVVKSTKKVQKKDINVQNEPLVKDFNDYIGRYKEEGIKRRCALFGSIMDNVAGRVVDKLSAGETMQFFTWDEFRTILHDGCRSEVKAGESEEDKKSGYMFDFLTTVGAQVENLLAMYGAHLLCLQFNKKLDSYKTKLAMEYVGVSHSLVQLALPSGCSECLVDAGVVVVSSVRRKIGIFLNILRQDGVIEEDECECIGGMFDLNSCEYDVAHPSRVVHGGRDYVFRNDIITNSYLSLLDVVGVNYQNIVTILSK